MVIYGEVNWYVLFISCIVYIDSDIIGWEKEIIFYGNFYLCIYIYFIDIVNNMIVI